MVSLCCVMLNLLSAELAQSMSHKTQVSIPSLRTVFYFALMKVVPIEVQKLGCRLVGVTAYSMAVTASFVSTGAEGRVHGPRGKSLST